ncbi:MAG: ferrous iron transport protein B [Spirochaetaceae bacterium]|nr:ferrous iron transport protein B [Spirochaetaceae bacterium]
MKSLLSELNIGDRAIVSDVAATGEIKRRLLDMGLCRGVEFTVIRIAPLGDPIVIKIKGFDLSLRMEEAASITVETDENLEKFIGLDKEKLFSPIVTNEKIKKNDSKTINVALLGNPNSGKTSLFNCLAGTHQKVGNFSGVTVEKYEGFIKYKDYSINLIDLPGTYSLTAYSPEEVVARNYIIEEKPDVVIDVIDGTNLERNLYLTTQLMELEVDALYAINMYDEVEKQGIKIDIHQLQTLLGSHVVTTSAAKKSGIDSLLDHIIRVHEGDINIAKNKLTYSQDIEKHISKIKTVLTGDSWLSEKYNLYWIAVKLLESDQLVYELVKQRSIWIKVERVLIEAMETFERVFHRDLDVVITEDRHSFIRGAIRETVQIPHKTKKNMTDYIDDIVLNRILGLPIFFGIMWLIFQFTFTVGQYPMDWLDSLFGLLADKVNVLMPNSFARSLIVDGIISGVGGVLIFVPNILLLFMSISIMEASGYMARAAFVVDKAMHKIGLHGKSFIPMITGFGCSVPAIMACRTLKNRADRITTMMIITFMSCGARLPVYILLIGAFFHPSQSGNVLFGVYMFGVLIALLSAFVLKKAVFKDQSEPFVMELPPYRRPKASSIFHQVSFKAGMYVKKAGTIILAASVLIWMATNYPKSQEITSKYEMLRSQISIESTYSDSQIEDLIAQSQRDEASDQMEYSFAGKIGKITEPLIRPLGFDWKIGIALTAGLAAKEIIVSTMNTIYSLEDIGDDKAISSGISSVSGYSTSTALALMIFVLLYAPCVAASAVFHKEAGRWKYTILMFAYTMSIAWIMSFLVYRISLLVF